MAGRSGRDVTDSAEQPRHMEPQLRSANAVASCDDRGQIDSPFTSARRVLHAHVELHVCM